MVHGLKKLFPYYIIERTGGIVEAKHGTDILVKIPGLFKSGDTYAVAIQVKDYEDYVSNDVIEQICKADDYFNSQNINIIEKVVIITKSCREDNKALLDNDRNVRIVFADELKELLFEMAKEFQKNNW